MCGNSTTIANSTLSVTSRWYDGITSDVDLESWAYYPFVLVAYISGLHKRTVNIFTVVNCSTRFLTISIWHIWQVAKFQGTSFWPLWTLGLTCMSHENTLSSCNQWLAPTKRKRKHRQSTQKRYRNTLGLYLKIMWMMQRAPCALVVDLIK